MMLSGLGVTMDDYGNVIPDVTPNVSSGSDYGYDAAGNTIVNPGIVTPSGAPASGSGLNLNALVAQGFSLTRQIIQTQPGVYTQQGPNGTITYKQPMGNQSILPFSAGGGLPTSVGAALTGSLSSSSLGIIALGGAALLLLMMMGRGR